MNPPNTITIEDNLKELLKNVLSLLDVKVLDSKFLVDMHNQLGSDKNILDGIRHILAGWKIETRILPLEIEQIKKLKSPALIFINKNLENRQSGRFAILLKQCKNSVTIQDINSKSYTISTTELKLRCGNILITLDPKVAQDTKDQDYERKLKMERDKVVSCVECVSVIMPVYNQASFIKRALVSLQLQIYSKWELILIDDGSTDNLKEVISPFLKDERIRYFRNNQNKGLGFCLNQGLDNAAYDIISYLPADDIYYRNHLQSLIQTLLVTERAFVFSGVKSHFNHLRERDFGINSSGQIPGYPLQLVQVLHRKTDKRWIERDELVTDDLKRMFWHHFLQYPDNVIGTREITCEWVDHSSQRHKIINDQRGGGIHLYKQTYGVTHPIKFQSTVGNYIDEVNHFKKFRNSVQNKVNGKDGLKILLVGELAFNPERIYALEERGHQLFGLWMDKPVNFNTIGPLPFGHVEDISINNWKQRIEEIKPDIIYALLNYHAVPLANYILNENPGIPFVWHFKEGPFYCRAHGTWNQLINLYSRSDGQIYTNPTVYEWFQQFLMSDEKNVFILDGDLPKKDWFTNKRSELLSTIDKEIHTVVAGRPMGLQPDDFKQLAEAGIHIHIYGEIFHSQFKEELKIALRLASNHLHLHPNCPQKYWVKEFSQYDAGWLHFFESRNCGELLRADWNDLNYPARMSTYAMAGLPMLMRNNKGHRVACQELLEKENMALLFSSFQELRALLSNKELVRDVRENVWKKRFKFSFDYHVDDLVAFFRKVIAEKEQDKLKERPLVL
ncbi:MAG: glycosyltransferase [Olivibacter sp.]|nr:glycosyltransferase [Olivibacter sp. UJ_SKK_5.1]